jgi:outer membrane receptor protein involved in Fe transport
MDYTVPIGTNLKIEVGAKFNSSLNENNNVYDTLNNFTNGQWLQDTNRSDNFRYTQQIFAQYLTASSSIGKLKYNAGIRSETTVLDFHSYRIDSSFSRNYTRFFPSVYLSYELNPSHQFNLSFSSRIQRPTFWNMNPRTDYSKPLNLSKGNPTLKPESSYAGEGGYMLNIENTTVTATLFYRYTKNGIERFRSILNGDTTVVMPMNIANRLRTGFELIAMQKITDWWKIDGNYTLYHTRMDASNIEGGEDRTATNWNMRINSVMNFSKTFEMQLAGNYRSKMIRSQGTVEPNWNLDASLRYNISRQLSLSLRIQDIFNTRQLEEYEYIPGEFYNTHAHHWYNRSYFVGMTYRFSDFKQRRDRNSDENVREGGGEE